MSKNKIKRRRRYFLRYQKRVYAELADILADLKKYRAEMDSALDVVAQTWHITRNGRRD